MNWPTSVLFGSGLVTLFYAAVTVVFSNIQNILLLNMVTCHCNMYHPSTAYKNLCIESTNASYFFFYNYKPLGSSIATRTLNSDYKLCIFPFICSCLSPCVNQAGLNFTFLKCYIIPAPPHNCIGWLVWFCNGGVIFILWNQTHMSKSLRTIHSRSSFSLPISCVHSYFWQCKRGRS